jgi:hypothetical protein
MSILSKADVIELNVLSCYDIHPEREFHELFAVVKLKLERRNISISDQEFLNFLKKMHASGLLAVRIVLPKEDKDKEYHFSRTTEGKNKYELEGHKIVKVM